MNISCLNRPKRKRPLNYFNDDYDTSSDESNIFSKKNESLKEHVNISNSCFDTLDLLDMTIQKRKPGRPRKEKIDDSISLKSVEEQSLDDKLNTIDTIPKRKLRKQGRPRKEKNDLTQIIDDSISLKSVEEQLDDEIDTTDTIPKRKPGRPRKEKIDLTQITEDSISLKSVEEQLDDELDTTDSNVLNSEPKFMTELIELMIKHKPDFFRVNNSSPIKSFENNQNKNFANSLFASHITIALLEYFKNIPDHNYFVGILDSHEYNTSRALMSNGIEKKILF